MSMNTPSQPIGATKQAAIVATVPDQAPVAKQWAYDPKPFLFSPNATPPGSPAYMPVSELYNATVSLAHAGSPAYMPVSELYNATVSLAHAVSPAYSPSSPGGTVAARTCCERRDPPCTCSFCRPGLHGFFMAPEQDVPCPTMPTIVL